MKMRKQVLALTIGILLVLSVFSVLTWQIKPVQATTVFSDDFETNNLNAWSGVSSGGGSPDPSTESTIKNTGTYAMQASSLGFGQWSVAYKHLGTNYTTLHLRAYVRTNALPSTLNRIKMGAMIADNTSAYALAECQLYYDGGYYYWVLGYTTNGGSESFLYSAADTIHVDQFYCIELRFVSGSGTGEARLYVNGTDTIDATGLTNNDYEAEYLEVGAYNPTGSVSYTDYIDDVVAATFYIGPIGFADTEAPTYSSLNTNVTQAGQPCNFSAVWSDNVGLSGFIFQSNNTGTLTNETWIAFSGTLSSHGLTLNATVGNKVQWGFYASDTSNNWNFTELQTLTLTAVGAPTYSNINANTTIAGDVALFSVNCSSTVGLDFYIFSTNNTGSWVNETAVAFSGNPAWANITKTLNATAGLKIGYIWYANSTGNVWSDTGINTLTTSAGPLSLTVQSNPIAVSYAVNSSLYSASFNVPTPVTVSGIQSAIDSAIAAGGGTVYIPAGDWTINQATDGAIHINLQGLPVGAWLNIVGSPTSNVTTSQQNGVSITCPATILRSYTEISAPTTYQYTFTCGGSNGATSGPDFNFGLAIGKHVRFSGITILGYVTDEGGTATNIGIGIGQVDGYLIDHCFIDGFTGAGIDSYQSKGVITETVISDYYHLGLGSESSPYGIWGYGVAVHGNSAIGSLGTPTWINNLTKIIGLYDWQGISIDYSHPNSGSMATTGTTSNISHTAGPVYIENNNFQWCRHAISSNQYGYYVARYNYFGQSLWGFQQIDVHGYGYPSGRGAEVYSNYFTPATTAIWWRGGGGVFFNNTIDDTGRGGAVGVYLTTADGGTSSNLQWVNDVWIWNNTYINVAYGFKVDSGIVAGTNYYKDSSDGTSATSPAPPRPSYVAYGFPFPHPMIGGFTSVTNSTTVLSPDTYLVEVETSVTVNSITYTFSQWEDTSTNPARLVTLSVSNISITATYVTESVSVAISIYSPANTTITSTSPFINFSASGGTIDKMWFNIKNGSSFIYVNNQTYTTPQTVSGFLSGTYILYAWANNTLNNIDVATVTFSVSTITGGTTSIIVNVWWGSYW
jgi:hypothetical protein